MTQTKVLVVEDEVLLALTLRLELQDLGYTIQEIIENAFSDS